MSRSRVAWTRVAGSECFFKASPRLGWAEHPRTRSGVSPSGPRAGPRGYPVGYGSIQLGADTDNSQTEGARAQLVAGRQQRVPGTEVRPRPRPFRAPGTRVGHLMESARRPGFPADIRLDGPIVLGVAWHFSEDLVRTAAALASGLGLHLICAFVDPASYLTEWESERSRTASSLEPAVNVEAEFPSEEVSQKLQTLLGPPGGLWTFRVLNGDVVQALDRVAESTGASLLIVGGPRPGRLARMGRLLEGSVSATLARGQTRPVLVVPSQDE
ncbi:MAG: universal stress protein [Arthrobacter sp.]|nr:universal stress protein [Arthrobacter sp.]